MDVSTNYRNSFAISLFQKMQATITVFVDIKEKYMEKFGDYRIFCIERGLSMCQFSSLELYYNSILN